MIHHPYIHSSDNKRYQTFNYFARDTYGGKTFKVGIDAGFSCPNRDGTTAYGGCVFCSARGSGDMIPDTKNIEEQIKKGQEIMENKWPDAKMIAYFQAYTNTHAPLKDLKKLYDPYFHDDRFVGIDIATRSDCLSDDKIAYFKEMSAIKDLTIEIGLQSIHKDTGVWMNRGHDLDSVKEVLIKLKEAGIRTCVHIINGLPVENKEKMMATIDFVAAMNPEMIKIHMLHLLRGTVLGNQYIKEPFPLLSKDEYIDIVVSQLERLSPDMVIARLTGDGLSDDLLAPLWTEKKTIVLNDIDKEMHKRDTWQGKYYKEKVES